jgi:hypothetical protein
VVQQIVAAGKMSAGYKVLFARHWDCLGSLRMSAGNCHLTVQAMCSRLGRSWETEQEVGTYKCPPGMDGSKGRRNQELGPARNCCLPIIELAREGHKTWREVRRLHY